MIGYAVIAWLLRCISTHNFLPFVIYRLVLAAAVAVLLLTGVLEPLPGSSVQAHPCSEPVRSRATRTAYAINVAPAMMPSNTRRLAP